MQTNEKKGISLVVLAVTIIVLAILVTLIPITIVNVVNNAKMATFIKDLEQIQDGVDSYVITNGSVDGIGVNQKTGTELLALVIGTDNKAAFESDLTSNGDYEVAGTNIFYEIDLSKIGVDSTSTGLGTLGASDKYYVSLNNNKVYYPYGKKIGGDIYFSLTPRLTGKAKVTNLDNNSGDITISPTDDKIITKLSTLNWSNNIDLTVDTVLNEGEYLRYTIGEATAYTTRIDSLPATINLSKDTMESDEQSPWREVNTVTEIVAKRNVLIERMNAQDAVISSKKIEINNLDILHPFLNSSTYPYILISKQGNYNIITVPNPLNTIDGGAGCGAGQNKEIRYEYTKKIDENGNEVSYYDNNPTISAEYLLKFGKVSPNFVIKLPENVSEISVIAVDKAGNSSGVYPFNIRLARRENINWTEFAKYTQTYYGRKVHYNTSSKYQEPIIPVGFRPVEIEPTATNPTPASWKTYEGNTLSSYSIQADYAKGLVIEDRLGNQFAWIPVNTSVTQYAKWCTQGDAAYNTTGISDGTLPTGVTDETSQINNYGGFWIARYESAFDYNGGNIRARSIPSTNVSTADWSTARTSAYNGYLFNCVSPTDAKTYAERMVNTPYVKSGLITGTAYDTMMKVISTTGNDNISTGYVYNILDAAAWGNTGASTGNALTGAGTIRTSGYSQWWKALNMYDVAGNVWEITNEMYSEGGTNYYIARGGSKDDDQIGPSYRAPIESTTVDSILGFRAMLFVI